MIDFISWAQQNESRPSTRTRIQAAKRLGPTIPNAAIHGHSTAQQWMVDGIKRRNRRKKKKSKPSPQQNSQLDAILDKINDLKDDEDTYEKEAKKSKDKPEPELPVKKKLCKKRLDFPSSSR